jgi:acetyl esterase/lipase
MKRIAALLALVFLTTVAALAQEQSAKDKPDPSTPPPPGVVTEDVIIGKGGDLPLHLRLIHTQAVPSTPAPAVLLVHGGGWAHGSYLSGGWERHGYKFVAAGFFAAQVEYRLVGVATWPAQIQDCKLAVRWLRSHAAQYGIDPNRIGCMGSSAGGHLVACLGTMDDDPSLEGDGGCPGVSSKVNAVIDISGPVNFTSGTFGDSDAIDAKHKAADIGMLTALLGGSFQQNPAVWNQASPITHLHAGDPPFLLLYGEKDPIVPVSQGIAFANALKQAGVPYEFHIVKNAGHILGSVKGLPPPEMSGNQVDDLMMQFLKTSMK